MVSAEYIIIDGVYLVDNNLYITSSVTSVKGLQVNPSAIYSFAAVPPECDENTFLGYGATLHMPSASYGAYFTADYWCNFAYMYNDAVAPTGVTISNTSVELIRGNTCGLSATVSPNNASLRTVQWSSTDVSIATVNNSGMVTAMAAGECDIVVTCLDKQAVCHVAVLDVGANGWIVGCRVDLGVNDRTHIADGVLHRTVNLRDAAERVGILHVDLGLLDELAAVKQLAHASCGVDLTLVGTHGMNSVGERLDAAVIGLQ